MSLTKSLLILSLAAFLMSQTFSLADETANLQNAVALYRKGQYAEAEKLLAGLHDKHPEDSKATYYLAITSAQLGRFDQARLLYNEVLTLDPNGEAARLAAAGLKYLPAETAAIDLPPKFQAEDPTAAPVAPVAPGTVQANGMSPQDMMMWQMMMSQMGGNGNNNNNGMGGGMPFMMPQMQGGQSANGAPMNMDPNVLSTMMMNQMMQNFDFSGDNNKDNN